MSATNTTIRSRKGKCYIIRIASINVSALTTSTKQEAISKWIKDEDLDVIGLCETCFKEGGEPTDWVRGYRCFFNSVVIAHNEEQVTHGRQAYKWGVALIFKECIKICDVIRPQGALNGRVIMTATFMESRNPKVLWVICAYAPVRTHEHDIFFSELEKEWKDNIKEGDQVVLMGDLNAHLCGSALERSNPNKLYDKDSGPFQRFVLKHGILDARGLMGAMDITRDFTYTHHDGTTARLDYLFFTSFESILTFQTVDFNRIATNHRAIIAEADLFRLTGGWKTKMKPAKYPVPINVTNTSTEQLKLFGEFEEKWLSKINRKLYHALVNNSQETDDLVLRKQNTFIEGLSRLCSNTAKKVWSVDTKFFHKRSKEVGILESKITWLRRAYKGAKELLGGMENNKLCRRTKNLVKRIKTSKWYPKLIVEDWWSLTTKSKQVWMSKIKGVLVAAIQVMRSKEEEEREERRDRRRVFLLKEGAVNSSRFRRWKLRKTIDPDGEVVKDAEGNIIVDEEKIKERYGEYYANLFNGEEERAAPPNCEDQLLWLNPAVIAHNKTKLIEATGGLSVSQEAPSLEEYYQIIKSGDPNSSGGPDLIQYGVLTKLSVGSHLAIVGLIGTWWRTRSLPSILRLVEVCSLHKRGDRMDLLNKRGIGLVCKLILIIETVLLNRVSKALDRADTRSRAQGGARKGVHTGDVIATLVNVIHHAKRSGKPLHIVEFDLFKFFDRIPHRAFEDAYRFFGFDEDTIKLAGLFWKDFVGIARSRFGHSNKFPINIGNIQGLAGSPSRSGLVLDMMLCLLERRDYGYRFTTDNFYTTREHPLDHTVANIYAVAWVDDITLLEDNFGRLVEAVSIYSKFANFYGLRFVTDKCKHYSINDNNNDEKELYFTDFNGLTNKIKKVGISEAFRCLGVYLNMNAEWTAHADHIIGKLDSFAVRAGKHWTPAWLTAKVTNSNAIPAVTYGMSIAELQQKEIGKMQAAVVKPVAKDGSHTKFAPRKAYSLPLEHGGYNLASIGAIYKATKLGGVYHFLNSTYHFANITSRMTFIDILRLQGSFLSPMDGHTKLSRDVIKSDFPQYMIAAVEISSDYNIGIIPRETWDLDSISINTFARCIANWDSKSAIIEILFKKGIVYMHQLSAWFRPNYTWSELGGVSISKITMIAALRGLNKWCEIPKEDPLDCSSITFTISSARMGAIRSMILGGVNNIFSAKHPLCLVPSKYKLRVEWKELRFTHFKGITNISNRWYTDGSRIGDCASFAVVDDNDNLIAKSNIEGRYTSQRAELKGLETATFLKPEANKVLDPLYIIKTVQKACKGDLMPYEWGKTDNRSLIRSIVQMSAQGGGELTWVKGHQKGDITFDGMHNIHADEQAKSLTMSPSYPLIDEAWEHVDEFFCLIAGNLFEGDVRKLAFNIILNEERESFQSNNERFRHNNWWMEEPATTEVTKFSTFRFKIFSRTLPTHDRLAKSFPGLYEKLRCPGCEEIVETDEHVFGNCKAYAPIREKIWRKVTEVIADNINEVASYVNDNVTNWFRRQRNNDPEGAGLWFLGGIPMSTKVWLEKYLRKRDLTVLWQRVHKVVMEHVRSIWDKRCEINKNKGWTFQELHLDFIEDAIILENNLLGVDVGEARACNEYDD